MINDVGTTERQLRNERNGNQMSKEANDPTEGNQNNAELPSHDGRVVQWEADGQVPVICHGTEEETFSCAQGKEEVELSKAAREGHNFRFGKKVDQHVGDCAGHVPDFQEGEVGQEHIHRGMELVVPSYCTNDGHIPHQSYHVDQQNQ